MKSKTVGFVVLALILITGISFLMSNDADESNVDAPSQTVVDLPNQSEQADIERQAEESTSKPAGSYVEYEKGQDLASTSDTKRIVFFHAEWCPTCKYYEQQIEEQGVPDGVTIIKADYDTESELKELLGVTVQSTFVLINREGDVGRVWPYAEGLTTIQDLYRAVEQS